ncbi:unnamed protein product [Mytilus edulis]|uniref:Endonuclease/exonuclease/phosphatase domain-containing protein n=1 Tax=Mytilus edulis TaxID=6550 RepID=A0A8S3RTG3_MYTED|nr:unnamed protein product [Mytilus edulis]
MTLLNTITSVITQPLSCLGRTLLATSSRRTRRGTRAGTRVIRHITALTGNRYFKVNKYSQSGINLNNIVNLNSCDSNRIIVSTPTDTESTSNIMTCVGHRPVGAYTGRNSDRPITLASVNIIPNIRTYPKSNMLFATLNCRSVKNKALAICDFVTSHDLDILAITESWLGSDVDEGVIQDLVPSGYSIIHHSRSNRRGGGIALLFKGGIGIKRLNVHEKHFTHFEHMEFSVHSGDLNIRLCVIYRPPPSKSNGFRNTVFFEEWESYLDQNTILVPAHNVLFTGDFNFHLDNLSDPDALRFYQSLEDFNLAQTLIIAEMTTNSYLN